MGLDQYASATTFKPDSPVDFTVPETEDIGDSNVSATIEHEEIMYWRKHPNLQGWMEQLYRKKGGKADSFNCVNVQLTEEDLDDLEKAVDGGQLPATSGFFFGTSRPENADQDRQFIKKARAAIQAGKTVYYSSWW